MALGFNQRTAIRKLAEILSNFLPASGHSMWKGHVNFGSVAAKLGLSGYWLGGSKLPAIINLLENTYEKKANVFQNLIETVVLEGKTYRNNKGNPLSRNEVDELNKCLLELEFKFPDLHNPKFLDSLEDTISTIINTPVEGSIDTKYCHQLYELKTEFYDLSKLDNRQEAGYRLEKLLSRLFEISALNSRSPFKVCGEQIDGSVEIDNNIYLIEVKWTKKPINESDLLVFRGKVEGKSSFTRGMFLSINGFTEDAIKAITTGKQPNFFLLDGYDLTTVLEEKCSLGELLRHKIGKLAEEGAVSVRLSISDIWTR